MLVLAELEMEAVVTIAVIALSLCGLAIIGFAYFAFWPTFSVQRKLNKALEDLTKQEIKEIRGLGEANRDNNAFDAATSYVEALGKFAEKLSKLSPPVAALVVSTLPFFFATIIAVVYVFES